MPLLKVVDRDGKEHDLQAKSGLKIIIGFTVAVALAMGIRALASEDGGPIMQAINYVGGWFTGPTAK